MIWDDKEGGGGGGEGGETWEVVCWRKIKQFIIVILPIQS